MAGFDTIPGMPDLTPAEYAELIRRLPEPIELTYAHAHMRPDTTPPPTPADQASELDPRFVRRPHIDLISMRVAAALADVQAGHDRRMIINTPPRSGKSTLLSIFTPIWALRLNPRWKVALLSYDIGLVTSWARTIRSLIESRSLGIQLADDGGAAATWSTRQGGGVIARSMGMPLTGYGASILLIDDPTKDFAEAHSQTRRDALWNWWLSVAQTRLEPPSLVCVTQTRWHEDDLTGRLLSTEHEGNPDDWEVLRIPAVADSANDPIGREIGAPLLSPLLEETSEQATARWEQTRRDVGTYTFSALHQQRPAPAKGDIFDMSWWRYWTIDPDHVSDTVHLLDPGVLQAATWIDSWDLAFKDTDDSDYVVGQRWVRFGPNRVLIAQTRGRRSFTGTLAEMRRWSVPHLTPYADRVHKRLVEDKANGPAIINTLSAEISGIKPVDPKTSKESRMRAVTPEIESGHVWLPYPGDPGNQWVTVDLLPEFRDAPHGAHDDQIDTLTQALMDLRTVTAGTVTVPRTPDEAAEQMYGFPMRNRSGRAAAAQTGRRSGRLAG